MTSMIAMRVSVSVRQAGSKVGATMMSPTLSPDPFQCTITLSAMKRGGQIVTSKWIVGSVA